MGGIQEEFDGLKHLIHSGLVYGSLVRDVDILLVIDNEQNVEQIRKELSRTSGRLERPLDVDTKSLDNVGYRIAHHDFYLGSVLATMRSYIANQRYLERAKEIIFGSDPTKESVLFNFSEGLHIFDVSSFALR